MELDVSLLVTRAARGTSDSIEVRWCAEESRSNDDVLTDLVEIWVLE